MIELDLTQTALIIKGRDGPTEDVLRLESNKSRLVVSQPDVSGTGSVYIHPESRECTPARHFADPEIHLRFDSEIKDPSNGWRFGLSVVDDEEDDDGKEEVCDVFLGIEKKAGRPKKKISHIHFRIFYNFESGILVLQNESGHGTTVLAPSIGDNGKKVLIKKGSQSLNPSEVTVVKVADLEFLLSYPTLNGLQKLQHEANWKKFVEKYKDALPGLGQLALSSSASTRPPSHRIGQRGGYTIFEELGRGHFGIVKRVTAYQSGAEYAAKEYFKTKPEQDARNLAEIATLMSLSHPHIVKFVDLVADLAGLMLVMDLIPQGNLKEQHREKRFSRTELKAIFRQVLKAVAYLHGKGRVHRDIKPENILLQTRDPPFAKLTDFGLATKDGFLRTECGTKKYTAPEIYEGGYGRSVDIWSIGASAFDIAEGLPDEPDRLSHKDWATEVRWRVTEACKEKADPFLGLLKEMLDIEPTTRPSAEACLSDTRLDISPRDDRFDLNQGRAVRRDLVTAISGPPTDIIRDQAPTERMSSSLFQNIVGMNKNINDLDSDEEAETRILYPAATSTQLSPEQPQTPVDALTTKARERQPTNEGPAHGQPSKRLRTGETNCPEPQQLEEGCARPAAFPTAVEEFLWNGQNFRKCLVNDIPVRMRIADQWFCFLDLAEAGGKNSQWVAQKASFVDPLSKKLYRDGNYERVLIAPHIALSYLNELGLQNNTALHQLISNGSATGLLRFLCAQLELDYGEFTKETSRAFTSDHQDSGNETNTLPTAAAMLPASKPDVYRGFPATRPGNIPGCHNFSILASESSSVVKEYEWKKQKFRKCLVDGVPVQMRVSDRWLNFTSLARAGGKSTAWKNKMLREVKAQDKEQCYDSNNRGMLLAYDVTLKYIAQLGLQSNRELRQLLQDDHSLDNLQPASYTYFTIRDVKVYHDQLRRLISASSLVVLAGLQQSEVGLRLRNQKIRQTEVSGVYVTYEQGRLLCDVLKLNWQEVEENLRLAESRPGGNAQRDESIENAATNMGGMSSDNMTAGDQPFSPSNLTLPLGEHYEGLPMFSDNSNIPSVLNFSDSWGSIV